MMDSEFGQAELPTGSMSSSQQHASVGTLDEPIRDTIMRDVESIRKKFLFILFPTGDKVSGLSRDWDLWGPFLLCLLLSVVLATQAPENQKGYVFAMVYVFVWAGSAIVTFNAVLLKGNISFFQTVCVLGYCILPLVLAAVFGWFANMFSSGTVNVALKGTSVGVALAWASKASVGFMSDLVPEDRKALAVYPVWLLYVAIAWIIFLS
jgi:hypothetical protein